MTSTLNKFAQFIDKFSKRDIWNNVIIIVKQSQNPEVEGQGAMKTGYSFNSAARFPVIGYRFLDDTCLNANLKEQCEKDSDLRKNMNVLTTEEVKSLVGHHISKIPKEIPIIFNDYKCVDCGADGDERLMPAFCHMEKVAVHDGKIERKHLEGQERYHPVKNHTLIHKEKPKESVCVKTMSCFGLCFCPNTKRYDCCGKETGEIGCIETWSCCNKSLDNEGCEWRYKCCQMDVVAKKPGCESIYSCCNEDVDSSGCKEACKKCEGKWGTKANNCFKKNHNVTEIQDMMKDLIPDLKKISELGNKWNPAFMGSKKK
jgi:hypothetical protein